MHTTISKIADSLDQQITLKGWLANKRSSGSIAFLEIRDGSGFIQAVVSKKQVDEATWNIAEQITQESSLVITGTPTKHPKLENVFELQVSKIELVHKASEYPISKKEHGPDFLLENRHLWLRSSSQWAVLRIRHFVKAGFQDYFNSNGFVELDTPTFTPTSCEGTTDLFEVDYFGRPAYLTQNGQLYLEAMVMSFGKVYDLCPNFRAEKSKTRKHLTEFWTLNPEMAFTEHAQSLEVQEASVKHMVAYVLEHAKTELALLERNTDDLKAIIEKPFKKYEYPDAIAELQKRGSNIQHGDDLGADDEVLLTEDSDVPVFVINWPASIKPFYMKRHPERADFVLNADLLAARGFGEIIGGSQREDDYKTMKKRILDAKLPLQTFEWYLDLRRYGTVPHCGFGIGIERMTRWMAGIHHIRETIPFPRMINRIDP